jgi:putative transposase
VTSLEHKYPVSKLCLVVGLSPSTFYYHRSKQARADPYANIRPVLREVFDSSYSFYGYRRIQAVLKTKYGFGLSRKTVLKLTREEGRVCLIRQKKYVSYGSAVGLSAANVLERDFRSSGPNPKWATDVTEFKVLGQKRYLSPVIDLFKGEVISYELAPSTVLVLVTNVLDKAF